MGYTHYYYTAKELAPWEPFRNDAANVIASAFAYGLKLGDGMGEGLPELTDDHLSINGSVNCGHKKNKSTVIPWPSPVASGIGESDKSTSGEWFAGVLLNARTCGGDCSYETFRLNRVWPTPDYRTHWIGNDAKTHRFDCCKTGYRPYDVVVTALLIVAKRHFGSAIIISSDGENKDWEDGRQLVQVACGYGAEFRLTPGCDSPVYGETLESAQ